MAQTPGTGEDVAGSPARSPSTSPSSNPGFFASSSLHGTGEDMVPSSAAIIEVLPDRAAGSLAPSSPLPSNAPSTPGQDRENDSSMASPSPPRSRMSPSASSLDLGSPSLERVSSAQTDSFSSPLFSKYRPVTKSASDGADVRWYFSKAPLGRHDPAAGVPTTEVVAKGEYLRFSKRDSLSLEAAFLQEEEELVSAWWKEYADCSEGPAASRAAGSGDTSPHAESSDMSQSHGHANSSSSSKRQFVFEEEESSVGVIVKGGLYEVDLFKRRCTPVYWRGDNMRVLRGHWFARRTGLDWLPLREDIAEQLESAYASQVWRRRSYQPSGQFAARVNLKSSTQGLHVLFFGEDDTWEAFLCVDATRVASVLGIRGTGFRLRRGFAVAETTQPSQEELAQRKEEEMDDYSSQVPVKHVVFMVHGIGQRLEKANLVDDVGTFRRTAAAMAEQHLTAYQRNTQRVLFIPCQWRRELKLRGETAVENCTVDGVRALRSMISATVHDVLYYMSPVYCQDIIDSVSFALNKLYMKFMKRNPDYAGQVSIYGHSLGSVLSYDILCHQHDLVAPYPIQDIVGAESIDFKESLPTVNDIPGKRESDSVTKEKQDEILQDLKDISTADTGSRPQPEQDIEPIIEASAELDVSTANPASTLQPVGDEITNDGSAELDALRDQVAALQAKLHSLEQNHQAGDKRPMSPSNTADSHGKDKEHIQRGEKGQRADHATIADTVSASKRHVFQIAYTKLAFEVDTFFAVGSPLGVFLSLRNIRLGTGEGRDYWEDDTIEEELPACRQIMNIFHPYDPVAYRIEPLVSKELIGKRPVFVPYHKGGKRIHIGMQELGENLTAQSKAIVNSLTSVRTRVASAFSANSGGKKDGSDSEDPKPTYGGLMMEKLTGSSDGRIDYMLQDATFEHQYIAAISSHTSYWQDFDTSLFIIKHLYRNCPEEPPPPDLPDDGTPSDHITTSNLQDEPDATDDEVAFTFFGKEEVVAALAHVEKAGSRSAVPADKIDAGHSFV